MRFLIGVCAACLLGLVLMLSFSANVEASTDRDAVSDQVFTVPLIPADAAIDLRRENSFLEDHGLQYRNCECSNRSVIRSRKLLRCRGGTCRV